MTALVALWLAAAPADVVKEIEVRASPGDVWKAWTTVQGAKGFFAPDAKIEAKPGGAYEIYFDPSQPAGKRGSEGCTVISAEPLRKLQFTWNFPPSIPALRDAKALTNVTVELLPQGKTVKVRLTQTGWKDEPAWHEGRKYFDHAWEVVLARLAHRFRRVPIDWNKPWAPPSVDSLRVLEGTFVSGDGEELQSWVVSDAGLIGTFRAIRPGKAPFYELGIIERDESEWVLSLQMFGVGLSPDPRTEKEAVRYVLDDVQKDRAMFVTEYGEPSSLEYVRHGDEMTLTMKRPGVEKKHDLKKQH